MVARHQAPGVLLVLGMLGALALGGCTKSEGPSSDPAPAATSAAPPSTAASSAALAAPDASPVAADTVTGNTPTAGADATVPAIPSGTSRGIPSASAAAAPSGASAELASANEACGSRPQPDCPLQAWMKANTNPFIASNDLPSLAAALEKSAGFAPPGYTNWASIAKDGARAAKGGDMSAAKASCRTCHDQYKAKYKAELRGRKI